MVLFTNFGTARAATVEETRQVHNATAGDLAGVALAQSLGDLSHLVYASAGDWTGELVFIDQWVSAQGLEQFFANPQVQAGGAQIFTSFDPVVWRVADGFHVYHISAPLGQNDRTVALLRATVTSFDQARDAMNEMWQKRILAAHRNGLQSHEIFVRLTAPETPESMEILGVDTWSNSDGMRTVYDDPTFQQALYGLFAGQPRSWALRRPAGEWIEW
jgi:quinol monooxygenase YgiN